MVLAFDSFCSSLTCERVLDDCAVVLMVRCLLAGRGPAVLDGKGSFVARMFGIRAGGGLVRLDVDGWLRVRMAGIGVGGSLGGGLFHC